MNGCECPLAGFCERHQLHKGEKWHRLCQSSESYREAWDRRAAGNGERRHEEVANRAKAKNRAAKRLANQSTEPVCVHRGDKIGTADCGCAGKPKVYQCSIHGLAMDRKLKPGLVPVVTSIGKQHFNVAYCNACGDFATKETSLLGID